MKKMRQRYPEIPLCCTARTCFKIIFGLPFLPFMRIEEDSFCIPMLTKDLKESRMQQIKETKSLLVKAVVLGLYLGL